MKHLCYILLILFSLIACRNNSFAPEPPEDIEIREQDNIFIQPKKGDIYYLGDEVPIRYRAFSSSGEINIHIIKKDITVYEIASRISNSGSFTWQTSSNTTPSVHYQVKLVDSRDKDIFVLSERFGVIAK